MPPTFIPPMLCSRLQDPTLFDDPGYVAEPKFDGQRAQLHVAGGRVVAVFSRPGRELLGLPGLRWLKAIRWPAWLRPKADISLALGSGQIMCALHMQTLAY